MPRNPRFSDELEYLQLLEDTVARHKPHLVNFLAEKSSDPDVLRLLEGFAYLSASLRSQIERQFPELTNSLVTMLWPSYARPFPSMTVMQFTPCVCLFRYRQEHCLRVSKSRWMKVMRRKMFCIR